MYYCRNCKIKISSFLTTHFWHIKVLWDDMPLISWFLQLLVVDVLCVLFCAHAGWLGPKKPHETSITSTWITEYMLEGIQGSANPQTPGSENKRKKNCVLLPAAGRRTQLFHLIFSEPGVCGFADPCTAWEGWSVRARFLASRVLTSSWQNIFDITKSAPLQCITIDSWNMAQLS